MSPAPDNMKEAGRSPLIPEPRPTREGVGLGVAAASGLVGTSAALVGAVAASLPVAMAGAALLGVAAGAAYVVGHRGRG